MDLLQLAPIVVLAAIVCLEAVALERDASSPFPRWLPWLLVAVAGYGLLLSVSALRGWLVVSPEFGLLMIEGGAVAYGSVVILTLLCAISVGLLVPAIAGAMGQPVKPVGPLVGFTAVAVSVLYGLHTLNPSDSPEVRIILYDLWSPALAVWLSLCLVESALRVLEILRLTPRVVAHAFTITALALVAVSRLEFLHPWTFWIWVYIVGMAFTTSVGLMPLWIWLIVKRSAGPNIGYKLLAFAVLVWCAGLGVFAWKLPEYRIRGAWIFWAISMLALIGAISWREHRARTSAGPSIVAPTRYQLVMLLGPAFLALGLFSMQVFEPTLVTAIVFVSWIVLAESTGHGAFTRVVKAVRMSGVSPDVSGWRRVVAASWAGIRHALATIFGHVRDRVASGTILGGVLKALVAVVVLIALGEVPNAGTTIIGSFSSVASDAKQKNLGQAIADHLLFELHNLNERLRPDITLVATAGAKNRSFHFVAALDETTNLDSELAKRPDVDLGPLKVPLNILAAPVRGPVRQLLGVRVIGGAVHEEPSHTFVLARSTSGEAWLEELNASTGPASDTSPNADSARGAAHRLAIQIVTSDRSSMAVGLTRSPAALDAFEQGWIAWQRFEIDENDFQALNDATDRFREATTRDWRFALAHYRLGRAYQRAGRPGAAAAAFSASLQASADFGPGLVALASTLYDHDSTAPPLAIRAMLHQGTGEDVEARFRKNKAVRLWQRVIRAPAVNVSSFDRAAAYAGLCLRASDLGVFRDDAAVTLQEAKNEFKAFVPSKLYRAWKKVEAAKQIKEPTAQQQRDLEALRKQQLETAAPIDRAQDATRKALQQLEELGADDARKALEPVVQMFDDFGGRAPKSEQEAERLTRRIRDQLDAIQEQRVKIQAYLTYFYCKRADKIYAGLVETRPNADIKAGAARVAVLLGDTLERRHTGEGRISEWSCMTSSSYPAGPYSRPALRYYDRAVGLAPDDGFIRCRAALTAYQLYDETRLSALKSDSDAHARLGDELLESGEFKSAIKEYTEAVRRDPNNVLALNAYAYTFWVWQYAWLQESAGVTKPEPTLGIQARIHAEHAFDLVEGKRPRPFEMMVRATLAEVLIGLGQFDHARRVLDHALTDASTKDQASYNEARWDLAQACLCMAHDYTKHGRNRWADEPQARAEMLLLEIRNLERGQEIRPFSTLLDGVKTGYVCPARDR